MDKSFKHELSWNDKAKINPLFAIMSDDIFANANIDDISQEQLDAFYLKGKVLWDRYLGPYFLLDENEKKVLEFGCGMGRLILQPAFKGAACTGVDISETQIELANKYFPLKGKARFLVIKEKEKINLPAESFDFVYSYAVLQHIKRTSDFYFALDEMTRLLRKGGKLIFQIRFLDNFNPKKRVQVISSINFENYTFLFYLKYFSKIPIPVFRKINHSHWGGAGCFISPKKVLRYLKKKGLTPNVIQYDMGTQNLIWLILEK